MNTFIKEFIKIKLLLQAMNNKLFNYILRIFFKLNVSYIKIIIIF